MARGHENSALLYFYIRCPLAVIMTLELRKPGIEFISHLSDHLTFLRLTLLIDKMEITIPLFLGQPYVWYCLSLENNLRIIVKPLANISK